MSDKKKSNEKKVVYTILKWFLYIVGWGSIALFLFMLLMGDFEIMGFINGCICIAFGKTFSSRAKDAKAIRSDITNETLLIDRHAEDFPLLTASEAVSTLIKTETAMEDVPLDDTVIEKEGMFYADKSLWRKKLDRIMLYIPSYKTKKNIAIVVAAIGVLLGILIGQILYSESAGLIVAIIGFVTTVFIFSVIAYGIINGARKEYGWPFSNREDERIKIYEDGLEYFWRYVDDRHSQNWMEYRIAAENIEAINISQDNTVLSIRGKGNIVGHEGAFNRERQGDKMYDDSTFRILLDFSHEDVLRMKEQLNALLDKADEAMAREYEKKGWEAPERHKEV